MASDTSRFKLNTKKINKIFAFSFYSIKHTRFRKKTNRIIPKFNIIQNPKRNFHQKITTIDKKKKKKEKEIATRGVQDKQ